MNVRFLYVDWLQVIQNGDLSPEFRIQNLVASSKEKIWS